MRKIRKWIQLRRDEMFRRWLESVFTDEAFLRQLQRVLQENKVIASPVFDGYLVTTGDITTIGKTEKPLDRIRQDIEHPRPGTIDIQANHDLRLKIGLEAKKITAGITRE